MPFWGRLQTTGTSQGGSGPPRAALKGETEGSRCRGGGAVLPEIAKNKIMVKWMGVRGCGRRGGVEAATGDTGSRRADGV